MSKKITKKLKLRSNRKEINKKILKNITNQELGLAEVVIVKIEIKKYLIKIIIRKKTN